MADNLSRGFRSVYKWCRTGPPEHAGAQPCRVAIGFMKSGRIIGIVVFNITNHFTQKYGLNYSGAFLKEKKRKEKVLNRNVSFS